MIVTGAKRIGRRLAAAVGEGSGSAAPPAGGAWRRVSIQDLAPGAALVLVTAVFSVLNPNLLGSFNLRAMTAEASILLIAALGETFVILLGSIDLSVKGVMATSSLIMALSVANNRTTLDLGVGGIALAVLAGAGLGLLNGLAHTKLKIPSLMVTLGTWFIGIGVATVLFSGRTPVIEAPTVDALTTPDVFGMPRFVLIALAVLMLTAFILGRTRFGRRVLAIGADERTMREMGVAVDGYKIGVFCLAGTLYGLAGVLQTALLGNGSVEIGSGMVFTTIAAVVAGGTLLTGGRGGAGRTVIGALLLTVIGKGMILAGVTSYVQPAVQGVIVILAVTLGSWSLRQRLRVIK